MSELVVLFKYYIGEFKRDWKNVPNRITLIRLFLGPIPAILLATGSETLRIYAFYGFITLICTDCVDGFLARILNQKTEIGRMLDPIADRVITGCMVIVLMFQYYYTRPWLFYILAWLVISAVIIFLIIFRVLKNYEEAEPNVAGKIKTILLSGLLICLVGENVIIFNYSLYVFVPYLATITLAASVFSFLEYIFKYLLPDEERRAVDCGIKIPAEDVAFLLLSVFIIFLIICNFNGIVVSSLSDFDYINIFWTTLFIVFVVEAGVGLYRFMRMR